MNVVTQPPTDSHSVRAAIRAGRHDGVTTGMAPGMVQANLVILPAAWAADFARFCELNPKPCPLIARSAPGDPRFPTLGADIDVRSDAPRYLVFEDGRCVDEVTDIGARWRDDFVAFALGCSYSFEEALTRAGLPVRHLELGQKVSIYVTDIACAAAGPFAGPMVVSMRPYTPADAARAAAVTARFPNVHGAPVHVGDPAQIGIADIMTPYSGPTPTIRAGEVPVFWACGVTPQLAMEAAKPPIAITHKPGHMLVTDVPNAALAMC